MKPKINLFLQYLLLLAGILVPIFLIDQSIYQNAQKGRTIFLPGESVYAIAIDSKDRVWIRTWDGVVMIENMTTTSYDVNSQFLIAPRDLEVLGIDEKDQVWVIGSTGVRDDPLAIYGFDGKDWVLRKKISYVWPTKNELPCCVPSDSSIVTDLQFREYSAFLGIDNSDRQKFLSDNQGNIWAGTSSGLVRFSPDLHLPTRPFMALHNFLSSGGYFLIGIVTLILYSAILLYKRRASYNAKDVLVSIWAGLGITIITFLLGTILIGALGLLLVSLLMPDCWESCPMAVIFFSPLLGGLIAVIAGTIRGRKKYQSIKKERLTNLPENKSTKPAAPILLIIWMIISQGVGIIFGVLIPVYLIFIVGAELDDTSLINNIIFCFNPLFVISLVAVSWILAFKKRYKIAFLTTTSIVVWMVLSISYRMFAPSLTPTPTPPRTTTPSPTLTPLPPCTRISITISPVVDAPAPSYDFQAEGFAPNSKVVVFLGDLTRGYMAVLEANDQGKVDGNIRWNGPARTEFTISFEVQV